MIYKFTSVVRMAVAGALVIAAMQTSKAQVVKTESFDNNFAGTVFPSSELPFGWNSGKVAPSTDANNAWDRVTGPTSALPSCTPNSGIGMVRFRSAYCVTAGEQGYLVSRPYDLSARGAVASTVSFWVYREATAGNDLIQVYANTVNDPVTGAPPALFDLATFLPQFSRPCNVAPVDPCGAWTQHTFQIPAAGYSIQNLYIIIKVTDAGAAGANVYIDDFSIQTYPSAQNVPAIPALPTPQILQNTSSITLGTTNNWIIGVDLKANFEGTQCTPLGAFTFTHNGSTSPGTDVQNSGTGGVKLWWTGGTNFFSTTNALQVGSYAGVAFPVANFTITPVIPAPYGGLLNGDNYFWLTYDVPLGATANDLLDADFVSANLGSCGSPSACGGLGCAPPGNRPIDGLYCVPSYTAGTSWLNGSFTNNDYVRQFRVYNVSGDASFQIMNNDHNDVGPPAGGNDPCNPIVPNGISPFSAHPPDYQKFAAVLGVPELNNPANCNNNVTFPAGACNRTTSFLRDVTNPVYHIDVQCGTWFGSNYIAAFIDFNHDYTFQPSERIFQSTAMNALTIQGTNFTIPAGAYYGPTTMRVREWYAQSNIDGCSPGYYGEVEDYTVILRPGCSPLYPGWKIWLGYTDDWNVNSNWCGGVPTINDNALIPGAGAQAFNRGAGTYHPVIKSGYLATTRKLVMLNDTVEINAPVPGSLRVSDSLSIGVASALNTSALIVDSSYRDTAQIFNGVVTNGANLLFRSGQREKSQLMYKTAELTGKGLINGDLIDSIFIPIRQRSSTNPWLSFQISYYYGAGGAFFNVGTGYTGTVNNISVAPINGAYPQGTVYTNPSMNLSGAPWNIPAGGGYVKIGLTTPIQVNTGGAPLIITICWEQAGAATPASDQTFQTQTVGYRSYMQLYQNGNNFTTPPAPPGCSMVDTTGYAFSNIDNQGFIRLTSDFRPNLTFKYHRVYTKYPIFMESNATAPASDGHWMNFGNFVPANSIVTFMGTTAVTQLISGTNNTTFDELKIANTGTGNVRQVRAATVNDTLWLTQGRLYLNGLTLTLMNNSLGAITRTVGYFQSEDLPPNYGMVNWKMGGVALNQPHIFPFINAAGNYIPFTYNPTAGTSDLTIGTYYPSTTPPSMLPLPTNVTTINAYWATSFSDAPNLVRRFWPMANAGVAPTADLTFGWSGTALEQPGNGTGTYLAQRWDNTGAPIPGFLSVGPGWWPPLMGGGGALVSVLNVTKFDIAWVLGLQNQPLPISLLNFTAKPEKEKVKLDWITASESNNDKFTVERTTDANEFTFIDELKSRGPSSGTLNYTTYDNNPKIGLQYYRLKQTDNNGAETLSKLIPVTFGKDAAFEIVTTINYDDGSFDVVFNYNSDLPYSYKIIDMLGNVVAVKTDLKAVSGSNIINIKTRLASGVYSIMIQNQDETISRKIFRQ